MGLFFSKQSTKRRVLRFIPVCGGLLFILKKNNRLPSNLIRVLPFFNQNKNVKVHRRAVFYTYIESFKNIFKNRSITRRAFGVLTLTTLFISSRFLNVKGNIQQSPFHSNDTSVSMNIEIQSLKKEQEIAKILGSFDTSMEDLFNLIKKGVVSPENVINSKCFKTKYEGTFCKHCLKVEKPILALLEWKNDSSKENITFSQNQSESFKITAYCPHCEEADPLLLSLNPLFFIFEYLFYTIFSNFIN